MSRTVLGKEIFTSLDERVDPAHTCLLVVDVQNDFCSPGGAADRHHRGISRSRAIIPPLSMLLNRARAIEVPIINIKMTTYEDDRTCSAVDLARRIHLWNGDMLVTRYGTWGHDNPENMPFAETDVVIRKHRNNAFTGTKLQQLLEHNCVRTVIVTGLSTHACVLETALAAQGFDFYVAIPTDCIASANPELNDAGLTVLKACLHSGGLTCSADVLRCWSPLQRGL